VDIQIILFRIPQGNRVILSRIDMNIEGVPHVEVVNNILSGFYYFGINKGIKARLFEFSTPNFPMSNFKAPYDAILPNPAKEEESLMAVAQRVRDPNALMGSPRTGKLYYSDRADLYGVCHGFGRNERTFYNGYNFYQAFYPGGYFQPPFGENISIFKANDEGSTNLFNGACGNITATEYNEQFGIVSKTASDISITTSSLTPNLYAPIYSPRETCPPDVAIENYFDEINFQQIQGTASSIGAGTYYNGNPIPTSLDHYGLKVNTRYLITGEDENRVIIFAGGRPVPSYQPDEQQNSLNNALCAAGVMETNVAAGRGSNGSQMIETADILYSRPGDQVFFDQGLDTAFYYWHFTFKENAATLPFYNNFTSIDLDKKTSNRTLSQGTQLFKPILSSDDSYWQNRQCPDTVDFLPWTFGASIYACPSEHFDIPYYSAIKKFGFYGTRFLNSCKRLNLENTLSGVQNASELPQSATNVPIDEGEQEPEGLDVDGSWTFSSYDNLLKIANAEERYSNMYALNKGFFLWANSGLVANTSNFAELNKFSGFAAEYSGLIQKFQNVFTGGFNDFVSGEPNIIMQAGLAGASYPSESINSNSDLLFTNKAYQNFFQRLSNIIPSTGMFLWTDLENSYGYYVSDGVGINESFYTNLVSGREKRVLTRYMENTIRGNPIDLFPLNHVSFAFDRSKDYLSNTGWNRGLATFHSSELPQINRRYFEGAYGKGSEVTGLVAAINQLSFTDNTAFYPGFFNDYKINKGLPTPHYVPVVSGIVRDSDGRKFNPNGWLALGYNEIGQLDGQFSCFTPLFVQQPVPKLFTKIGQAPTLRALGVDYHTLPDDKISYRYPEIIYWAYKLKLIDGNFKNLYPLKYKWLRVPKNEYLGFLTSGNITTADFADMTGNWACQEGDGPECTIFHPKESFPTGNVADRIFTKGVKQGEDDNFYYMCMASGRFGVRLSEKSELVVEDWMKFDVSVKNSMNQSADLKISFGVWDKDNTFQSVEFEAENQAAFNGYQQDIHAIPESVVEMKIPPPNAGFGDVKAYRFVGSTMYVGATRSYQPDSVKDTRGLRGAWGRFVEYGALVSFSKNLTQFEGDLLYGYKHLPVCDNYDMAAGKKGIQVIGTLGGYAIGHWTLYQQAVASVDSSVGIKWDKLDNLGALYPPITQFSYAPDKNGKISTATPGNDPINGSYGIGHWQWGNNLGSIKRFGQASTVASNDLVFVGRGAATDGQVSQELLNQVKEKLVGPSDLAGTNCGYTPLGLGRNMIYYIEAYERFYILCDLLKKKNVRNLSFMSPGIRSTNAAIQYFWLGHPSNTYLERRPMYGPYAYQWRVKRHNRDRNGNGMSEGFYSMGWGQRYSQMYDAPAIYGLYVKKDATEAYKSNVKSVVNSRNLAFPQGVDLVALRSYWFGIRGTEGTSKPYGTFSLSCDEGYPGYNEILCNYVQDGQNLANGIDFKAYGCTESQLARGQCFDPCISMRYGQGFFAGGKAQNLFGYTSDSSQNIATPKNIRLAATANVDENDNIIVVDEQSPLDKNTYFRSPLNTPHARITRGLQAVETSRKDRQEIFGISPCQDGGSDHCNFLTPTIHLKTSAILLSNATAFAVATNFASNLYETYNIRGDES
jgi:hypothetical protein